VQRHGIGRNEVAVSAEVRWLSRGRTLNRMFLLRQWFCGFLAQ